MFVWILKFLKKGDSLRESILWNLSVRTAHGTHRIGMKSGGPLAFDCALALVLFQCLGGWAELNLKIVGGLSAHLNFFSSWSGSLTPCPLQLNNSPCLLSAWWRGPPGLWGHFWERHEWDVNENTGSEMNGREYLALSASVERAAFGWRGCKRAACICVCTHPPTQPPSVGLELTTLRSLVSHSSDGANQVPLKNFFPNNSCGCHLYTRLWWLEMSIDCTCFRSTCSPWYCFLVYGSSDLVLNSFGLIISAFCFLGIKNTGH